MPNHVTAHQLIRYAVGYVFIASAIMKLVISDFTGTFAGFGLPYPELVVLLVGLTELICGGLILFNYYVRQAAIPLFIIMVAAFFLTKVPILETGFFQFLFDARLDIVMLILLFILWKK
ncbi:DoxX family protein [Gracilibacillus salinarum]|uniref:DoxX family protein n=1 Tax=Gracilibacillus salinarum TaxID=2932255 RepID=A0ABY4GGW1_9BACI|nr:DoxX family protein [Gracilibacillus salinarum]UOQ83403.1 DoxX family protein [Gracilibacillus salinarum]